MSLSPVCWEAVGTLRAGISSGCCAHAWRAVLVVEEGTGGGELGLHGECIGAGARCGGCCVGCTAGAGVQFWHCTRTLAPTPWGEEGRCCSGLGQRVAGSTGLQALPVSVFPV